MSKILLIDDDEIVRTPLRLMLSHLGHQVTEARNGREALKSFRAAEPDLIITDIIMPEMDGLEFLMALRKLQPDAKIIAMSGGGRFNPMGSNLHLAKSMGALKVLAKPFSHEELRAVIAELLPGDVPQ